MDHKDVSHVDILVAVARLETKVDTILETLPDHERRIRGLERFRNWAAGAGAIVAPAVGFIFAKVESVSAAVNKLFS